MTAIHLKADWLTDPGTQAIWHMLQKGGYQAFFVGGCVRNSLLGAPVDDIDITTDAPPEKVMALCETAGLRAIPTGIDHGTVTVIAQGKPHQITTLRRDITTDGRHATVAFTHRIEDDAARRDFTMNALYARDDGTVLDPTGNGIEDLNARRIRFIGTPEHRIREDHLRILRFFRFYAWYGDPSGGMDAEGLAACAAHAARIAHLSKERIGAEIKKLLSAPEPAPAMAAMEHAGILVHVLPGATAHLLPILTNQEALHTPNPMRRLASLGGENADQALRLSRAEAKELTILREHMGSTMSAGALGYRFGAAQAHDILLLRAAVTGTCVSVADVRAVMHGAHAVFPITAHDLMPTFTHADLGARLRMLEEAWVASEFTLDRVALLTLS